ncbi:DUF1292 domain-containing protein [Herbivorax sp. ANBcel31]|uniref:DUF1292 domain-containing protein n=1 Tax=Herbivorax sp. ANBcel31 TaxID=3069754 RepID=UPI0027B61B22|nr:DUF1292 domain-containing protein [Herbivorax sp. ANBcel31]MDQ2087293.1 DUF1292 domain-containing protein [Herbivorax sp. ANBcel31]
MTEERDDLVVLVDENGEEAEFEHLDTIKYEGNDYVVLLPFEQEEDDDSDMEEVIILKVDHSEVDGDSFLTIDDDDELDAVFEQFKTRMEEEFEFFDN